MASFGITCIFVASVSRIITKMQGSYMKSFQSANPVVSYVMDHSLRLTKEQKELNEATLKFPTSIMLGAPEVLQLNANLIRLIGGKKIIDVGVYTGASTLSSALAIPEDGKVYAMDINEEAISIGRPYWKAAGIEQKVNLMIGSAIDSLQKLIYEGQEGTFDFAFIDADKVNVINYYEMCLRLVRSGGIVAIDNTIWGGSVIDLEDQSPGTRKIRELNEKLKNDDRINLSFLVTGDGLSLCFKK